MVWVAILTASTALTFDIVAFSINVRLLFMIFVSKKIKRSDELSLFYARFLIDVFLCFSNASYQLFILLHFLDIHSTIPLITFLINFPSVSMMPIRAIMVLLITIDRTLAVYVPIKYHIHRRKVSNRPIILSVFAYLIFDSSVLWLICGYQLIVPPRCLGFKCINDMCYIGYWVILEQTLLLSTGAVSVLMMTKLLLWKKCAKGPRNSNFVRANRLALIDILIIALFDFIPLTVIAKYMDYDFEQIGPLNAAIRLIGYTLEGIVVTRALVKKSGVPATRSGSKVIQVS